MQFVNLGAHCANALCGQQDFLPFKCEFCLKEYCKEHRGPSEHSCGSFSMGTEVAKCPMCGQGITLREGVDPNISWDTHFNSGVCYENQQRKSKKCPVGNCKTKLNEVNSCVCSTCGLRTCLTHRFPDQHNCKIIGSKNRKKCAAF